MKGKVIHFICLSAVVIGIALTLKSVSLGISHANSLVYASSLVHVGVDTASYLIYLQESINSFREAGLAILLIAGLCEVTLILKLKIEF